MTELHLSSNQLTTLPDSLGQLTQLTNLDLSNNQLTALPTSLGQLTQLTELRLSYNQLATLPESFGQLKQLQLLILDNNILTTMPEVINQIVNLKGLELDGNQFIDLPKSLNLPNLESLYLGTDAGNNPLINLPECIRKMKKLRNLWVKGCGLKVIPEWLGELDSLEHLWVSENQIQNLPVSLSKLKNLNNIQGLNDNPLNPALQSAYEQGLPAVMAYLRSLEQNAEPLYEAKLVLVGEGNVGKTTLLKALKGKAGAAPQEHEPTTHGVEIDIHGLRLPHPTQDGVEIQLNAWDFGGQDVYRVTHQFFFSRRSLYLLVWEPRRGVQQGQVEDWLNMIRLRVGDDARVIIVSTHCKTGERIARIDQPVFKQQYGEMIVGFHEVDSLVPDEDTGEMVGIAELKKVIAEHASKLEQMGMGFNRH